MPRLCHCGQPAAPYRMACEPCLAKKREQSKKLYWLRRSARVCAAHGCEKEAPVRCAYCPECKAAKTEKARLAKAHYRGLAKLAGNPRPY